ncbi:MAG: cupredoxin domain-containing protein, partial [Chloroflexota bacterium]|nr:cupredoxin domain-containing protein [Chloroflexota bacterium]
PAASAATRTINVTGVITGFSQPTINVTAGETVSICLTSTDIEHDLTIASANFKVVAAKGAKVCKTLVVPMATGSKPFICSIPGHASAGMTGNLVIGTAGPAAPAPAPAPAPGSGSGGSPQADPPVGGVQTGGGSTAGLTHVSLLMLGGGLLIAAMMSAFLSLRVTRKD